MNLIIETKITMATSYLVYLMCQVLLSILSLKLTVTLQGRYYPYHFTMKRLSGPLKIKHIVRSPVRIPVRI